jgi:hypothetical protein
MRTHFRKSNRRTNAGIFLYNAAQGLIA